MAHLRCRFDRVAGLAAIPDVDAAGLFGCPDNYLSRSVAR